MNSKTKKHAPSTDRAIANMAAALCKEYGIEVAITLRCGGDAELRYNVSGGGHHSEGALAAWLCGHGATLAEAATDYRKQRAEAAARDHLANLKKQAAAAGFELVPAAKPLDLQPCSDA